MKTEKILSVLSKIYGIVITLFMLVAFGPKLFGSSDIISKIPGAVLHWYDNPTGFFLTYLIGYALIWWRPLFGAVVIIAGGLLFFIANPHNMAFVSIFLFPTMLVGVLYFWHWLYRPTKSTA